MSSKYSAFKVKSAKQKLLNSMLQDAASVVEAFDEVFSDNPVFNSYVVKGSLTETERELVTECLMSEDFGKCLDKEAWRIIKTAIRTYFEPTEKDIEEYLDNGGS